MGGWSLGKEATGTGFGIKFKGNILQLIASIDFNVALRQSVMLQKIVCPLINLVHLTTAHFALRLAYVFAIFCTINVFRLV